MFLAKHLILCLFILGSCAASTVLGADPFHAGFLYDDFTLTLAPGHRTEVVGPLFAYELKETQHQWVVPPLALSHTWDKDTDSEEYDFLYPVLTYDRFGAEYRWQFFQLLGFGGGKNPDTTSTHRFSIFPIYFQQRSDDPKQEYTAVFPFYGHLDHRFFRDEIDFVLFPCYSKTRKKDVITYNMPYPFFHLRYGDGLHGWQVFPFVGKEHKEVTAKTNQDGETNIVAGHDRKFILWPFYTQSTNGIGTEGTISEEALIPFYYTYRSKLRDSTCYGWPFGVTHTIDREKKYEEWDYPWPLVEFSHGDTRKVSRVWPFYSRGTNQMLQDIWYAWPIYKYNRLTSAPLDRERTRILFFLYSYVNEKNTESGRVFQRGDLWPLYTHRREFNGNERWQFLSILDPIFPNNKSIERDYSPLYSVWRTEKNAKTGAASQSLLWNLYRHEAAPEAKKTSLLFGLFQYQSEAKGKNWRIFYVPVGGGKIPPADKNVKP